MVKKSSKFHSTITLFLGNILASKRRLTKLGIFKEDVSKIIYEILNAIRPVGAKFVFIHMGIVFCSRMLKGYLNIQDLLLTTFPTISE